MGSYIFLIIGFCALLGFGIFNAFIAGSGKSFSSDPAAYQGQGLREEASQHAEDTAEKNRRLMETMRERMDRNKF